MKHQVHRKTVTDRIHKQRVQSVAGTMAIEGLTLSEASRRNLDRYASGQANFQQIMAELKAKYQRAEKCFQNMMCTPRCSRSTVIRIPMC